MMGFVHGIHSKFNPNVEFSDASCSKTLQGHFTKLKFKSCAGSSRQDITSGTTFEQECLELSSKNVEC